MIYKYLTLTNGKTWLKIIKMVEDKYNSSRHHATLMPPRSIGYHNSEIVFRNLYRNLIKQGRKPPKFKLNDTARVLEPIQSQQDAIC